MMVNTKLLEALLMLVPELPIVLAADNMACFAHAIASARSRPSRRRPRQPELQDWADVVAEVICSSDIGTLKGQDTRTFFGTVLSVYGLGFSGALSIDDRADNCEAFAAAVDARFNSGRDQMRSVRHWSKRVCGSVRIANLIDGDAWECSDLYPA